MTHEICRQLPVCKVSRDDPAHPPMGRRIKHFGMNVAGQVAAALGTLPGQQASDEFGILVYHRVAPVQPGFPRPTLNVTPDGFREQITGLKRRGFTFLPLREVLRKATARESLPARTAVITFDDGFESVYEYAWPTLQQFDVPATIFLNTGYLNHETPFPFDAWGQTYAGKIAPISYRPLSESQCRAMADNGLIELGAHTHTHADFRGRDEDLRFDMEVCLQELEKRFGVRNPSFAFPSGKPSMGFAGESSVAVVQELGVTCALTTEAVCARATESPFSWGRFNVYDWDSSRTLAAKLQGYFSWAPRLAEGAAQLLKKRSQQMSRPVVSSPVGQLVEGSHG